MLMGNVQSMGQSAESWMLLLNCRAGARSGQGLGLEVFRQQDQQEAVGLSCHLPWLLSESKGLTGSRSVYLKTLSDSHMQSQQVPLRTRSERQGRGRAHKRQVKLFSGSGQGTDTNQNPYQAPAQTVFALCGPWETKAMSVFLSRPLLPGVNDFLQ